MPVYATSGVLARDPRPPFPVGRAGRALSAIPPASRMPREGRRVLRERPRARAPPADGPEALYGYEAMRLVLDAIRAGGPDRRRVYGRAWDPHPRSAIGRYAMRGTGDVDTHAFSSYELRDGRFSFAGMVR